MKKIFAVALACLMLCSTFMLASCGITEHSPDDVIDKLPIGGIESDLVIDKNPDGGTVDDGNVDDGKPDNGNPDDGDPNGVHEHEFNLELVFEEFLVSPATCTEKAVYYKSCKCKEKSEETFEWGEPLGHSFSDEWSSNAREHWHAATCEHENEKDMVSSHINLDGNGVCLDCGFDTIVDSISFDLLKLSGKTASGKVSNATESFDLSQEVVVGGNATYYITTDEAGENAIDGGSVELQVGDNTFYVQATLEGKSVTYTLNIRRREIYTITFEVGDGRAVEPITVEEDEKFDVPFTSKWGFVFDGWDYDFTQPITSSMTVSAKWKADPRATQALVNNMTPQQLFEETKEILDEYSNFTLENTQTHTFSYMGEVLDMLTSSYTSHELIDGDASAVLAWNEQGTLVVDKRYVVDPLDEANNVYYYYDIDSIPAMNGMWKAYVTVDDYYAAAGIDRNESRLLNIPESALTDIQFYVDEETGLCYIEYLVEAEHYQRMNPSLAGMEMCNDVAYRLYFNDQGEFQNLLVHIEGTMSFPADGGQSLEMLHTIEIQGVFTDIGVTEVAAPENADKYPLGQIQIPDEQ